MDRGDTQQLCSETDDIERREHLVNDYLSKCIIDENVDAISVKSTLLKCLQSYPMSKRIQIKCYSLIGELSTAKKNSLGASECLKYMDVSLSSLEYDEEIILSCMEALDIVDYSDFIVEDCIFCFSIIALCLRFNLSSEAVQFSIFNFLRTNLMTKAHLIDNIRMDESMNCILDQLLEAIQLHFGNEILINLYMSFFSFIISNRPQLLVRNVKNVYQSIRMSIRLCLNSTATSVGLFISFIDRLLKDVSSINVVTFASNELLSDLSEALLREQAAGNSLVVITGLSIISSLFSDEETKLFLFNSQSDINVWNKFDYIANIYGENTSISEDLMASISNLLLFLREEGVEDEVVETSEQVQELFDGGSENDDDIIYEASEIIHTVWAIEKDSDQLDRSEQLDEVEAFVNRTGILGNISPSKDSVIEFKTPSSTLDDSALLNLREAIAVARLSQEQADVAINRLDDLQQLFIDSTNRVGELLAENQALRLELAKLKSQSATSVIDSKLDDSFQSLNADSIATFSSNDEQADLLAVGVQRSPDKGPLILEQVQNGLLEAIKNHSEARMRVGRLGAASIDIPAEILRNCGLSCIKTFFVMRSHSLSVNMDYNISVQSLRRHLLNLSELSLKPTQVDIVLKTIDVPSVSLLEYSFICCVCVAHRFPALSASLILQKLSTALDTISERFDSVFTGRKLQTMTDEQWFGIREVVLTEKKILKSIYDCYLESRIGTHKMKMTSFSLNSVALFAKDFDVCPQLMSFNILVSCFRSVVYEGSRLDEILSSVNEITLSFSDFLKFIGLLSCQSDRPLIKEKLVINVSHSLQDESPKSSTEDRMKKFLIWLDSSNGKDRLSIRMNTMPLPLFSVTKIALIGTC